MTIFRRIIDSVSQLCIFCWHEADDSVSPSHDSMKTDSRSATIKFLSATDVTLLGTKTNQLAYLAASVLSGADELDWQWVHALTSPATDTVDDVLPRTTLGEWFLLLRDQSSV